MKADYIILGAGSAGCVLANRLSEDPNNSVILLEAGGSDSNSMFSMPLSWLKAVMNPSTSWNYFGEAEPHLNNRKLPIPRAKVLGGCSSINGMMYSRGQFQDYDTWAELGLEGWSYADILPYFRRSETNWRGQSKVHGDTGPLTTSRLNSLALPINKALLSAAKNENYEVIDDFADGTGEGFSAPDFTVHQGKRASTSARYLHPIKSRPNLQIITGALTTKILFNEDDETPQAIGVEFTVDGQQKTAYCNREIIVSAGAINSPQILMLSGIGPKDPLEKLGITSIHDLPGVGGNLQEHTTINCAYQLNKPIGFESELRLDRLAFSALRWYLFKTGPLANMPPTVSGFFKAKHDVTRPGIQFIFTSVAMDAVPWFPGFIKGAGHKLSTVGVQLHPKSRGSVTLRSADPTDSPCVRFNMLDHPEDLIAMREIVRKTRNLLTTSPVSDLREPLLIG